MARLAAGTRKRADGTLEKRFTIEGKRYSVYGKTAEEISDKESAIREAIKTGTYTKNRNITLDKYFEEWKARKRGTVKGATLRNYECYYRRHISPVIGARKVASLERREIAALQRAIAEKVSASAANICIVIIKSMLREAVRDEIIIRNAAEGITDIKDTSPRATETIHRALTETEQREFMTELQSDPYYEFIAFLLCTGTRTGEAAALEWGDIDTKARMIHIRRTVTYKENGERTTGTPKSSAGARDIPMTAVIDSILARQRKKYGEGYPMGKKTVFATIYGGTITSQQVNRAICAALDRLEKKKIHIERFTAHALRDTFATRYIEQGGTPQTLKTILGHSSLSMTMDLYAHVLPNTKSDEMNRIKIAI